MWLLMMYHIAGIYYLPTVRTHLTLDSIIHKGTPVYENAKIIDQEMYDGCQQMTLIVNNATALR